MKCVIACVLVLLGTLAWGQEASWPVPDAVLQAARSIEAPAPLLRRAPLRALPRVSSALTEILDQYTGALAAEPLAVRITLQGEAKPAWLAELQRMGGMLEVQQGKMVYASLPANQIERLARTGKGIRLIEAQAVLSGQALNREGGAEPAALPEALLALQQRARNGRGVRVGIIDFGFAGYAAAGLAPPLAQRAGKPGASVFEGSAHGIECARLIQQMAPEASLLLASVGDGRNAGEGQVLAAAQWLAAQGAQLINISASGYLSALDGSAPLDQMIARLARQGHTTIVAAGNHAQQHWRGRIADTNRNGWVDGGVAGQGDLLVFEVTQAGPVSIDLNWTPWNGSAADLDVFLYAVAADGRSELLAQADTVQAAGAVRPVEVLGRVLQPGHYLLGLRATRLAAPGDVHVFVQGAARMRPFQREGSLGSPGTAAAAVTVGAAAPDGLGSAPFSARGPTEDGRAKPELLAQIPVSGFIGTSAAAPLVTGFAALLLGADPALQGEALRQVLRQAARPADDASARWGVLDLTRSRRVPGAAGAEKEGMTR
ncbi:S8 family serine peptidase [Uliginosibacterium sp. 31-16]|uniref:S8 family serine peptidase n=1 Tax=Uliginosibacterium sp. 31-16 TaxID=3068315 RepID=UPI00273EFC1B|nr:S8 family serine peptidase [Uliginosibacterium sp. 31-16]MDP5238421.1 S8 family serine peptidase [Uliginosibacterium sp. 31-16]